MFFLPSISLKRFASVPFAPSPFAPPPRRHSGFTLIELLIVIGIIGVLAGVIFTSFSGVGESANAAKCMTNMRNLAVAAQSYGTLTGLFPMAGTSEFVRDGDVGVNYTFRYGWISGYESKAKMHNRKNPSRSSSHDDPAINSVTACSAYESNYETGHFCITNGSLWGCVGGSSAYVCPSHRIICSAKNLQLHWSYVLNGGFGYKNPNGKNDGHFGVEYGVGEVPSPDRKLLFAELPFIAKGAQTGKAPEMRKWGVHDSVVYESAGEATDAILQLTFKSDYVTIAGAEETIGFNHLNNKKACAHVAFADGHVAKVNAPNDVNDQKLKELTKWLCRGDETSFDGREYKLVDGEKDDD